MVEGPIAYLVRAGSVDKTFPLLSDPNLSDRGIEQANEVHNFFVASGIGPVKAPMTPSGMQFAEIVSLGMTQRIDLPPVIVTDDGIMQAVNPGGIVAVFYDGKDFRYEPKLGAINPQDMN